MTVVISMRSDFYNLWPQDDSSIALLRSGHFPVGVPGAAALEKIIVEPANAAGLAISPRLVQRILTDTGTAPGALALAEFALAQLYADLSARRQDNNKLNQLSEDAYQTIGGVAGAINGLAEEAVTAAQAETALNDETFAQLFRHIASVEQRSDDGTEAMAVVRRRATQHDLSQPVSVLTLARHLVERRILVSRQDNSDAPVMYEVGHEAVFSHWRRFKDWHARYADDLALCRQAEQAARDWDRQHHPAILQWGWERQKPAILAFAKLQAMIVPELDDDIDFSDSSIALWHQLESHLEQPLRQFLRPEPLALLAELSTDDTSHQRREEIGLRLNQIGDQRRGVGLDAQRLPDIVWIDIPAGEITLETGNHFAVLPFRIARYPVTWVQYRAFVEADDGYVNTAWWQDLKQEPEPGQLLWAFANYPVIDVSWYDAVAFCRWLSAKRNLDIRLPAEWEWQWAAIGDSQQDYPWPGEWNPAQANSYEAGIGRTVAVGMYPLGRNRHGVDDMAGNVWQWCLNAYKNPENTAVPTDESRVLRGGSWNDIPDSLRASIRNDLLPVNRNSFLGFRVLCQSPILE